jgi:hypothetical protein
VWYLIYAVKDLQREILNQVATGTISAEEGAARLEALEAGPAPAVEAQAAAPVAAAPSVPATRHVKVVANIGMVEIAGDPSVAFVTADGPHRARQEGDTMVIDHLPLGDDDNFSFGSNTLRRIVRKGFDLQRRGLTVRMNPDLALIVSTKAGDVQVDGVHGPISAEIQAGNCTISDFRSPFNLVVQAGSLNAIGRLDGGASKVRCQMGSVKINLEKGSSVRISARTTMADVAIEGAAVGAATGSVGNVVTIGGGAGTLDVDCTMGDGKVVAD